MKDDSIYIDHIITSINRIQTYILNLDRLIHDYIDVDLEIVWKTASESIPQLKGFIATIQ